MYFDKTFHFLRFQSVLKFVGGSPELLGARRPSSSGRACGSPSANVFMSTFTSFTVKLLFYGKRTSTRYLPNHHRQRPIHRPNTRVEPRWNPGGIRKIPGARNNKQCSQNEIYDIGTEILTRSRFFTKIIKSFYKSIIPQEIKSPGHPLSSGSVKTRFKAIFKK